MPICFVLKTGVTISNFKATTEYQTGTEITDGNYTADHGVRQNINLPGSRPQLPAQSNIKRKVERSGLTRLEYLVE
jgi:hypothetical protein